MIINFVNKTGSTIALRNSDSKSTSGIVSNNTFREFLAGDTIHEFKCKKRYLIIKMDCDPKSDELSATILPIPVSGMSKLYAVIGCGDREKVPSVVENLTKRIVPGDEVPIPKIEDDDFLMIGLGKFRFNRKLRNIQKTVYLGVNKITTLDMDHDLGSMAIVMNINVFMGAESAISTVDKYQLIFIAFVIIIIIIIITFAVSSEIYRGSNK